MKVSDVTVATKEQRPKSDDRTLLLRPTDISPYVAYLTLREWFGPSTWGRDVTRSQWAYGLRVPSAFLDIYDWRMNYWSIGIFADSKDVEDARRIGDDFLELFRKQAVRQNVKIKEAANKATGFVLQNPFVLYYVSAKNILAMTNNQEGDQDSEQTHITTSFAEADLCRSAFFLFIASFEGLMNLIYELYLKTELRDERIYDRLAREQIDVKVRLAPVYCDCFKANVIQHDSEAFKRFHSIVNLRNDFIHANLTKSMKRPIVNEDDCFFVVENSSRDKYGLPKSISEMTAKELLIVEQSVEEMIEILLDGMKPRYKREFRIIMEEEYIQVELEDGELVVVLD